MPFHQPAVANHPSGLRRFTPVMLAVRDQADQFQGAPKGEANPWRYLAAFQEAEPYLGLPPQTFKFVSWLVKQTMPCDWEEGSRPMCWPSAARQAEFLGLSEARVKVLNRALYEAGILVIRDSETGKRYGRRGPDGRIIEAYGFDLSPLAYRCDEFIRIAAEARAERERLKALRKRATCARRAIRQIGEALAALDATPAEWSAFAAETAELVKAVPQAESSNGLALVVKELESRKIQAEEWLRQANETQNPVKTSPLGLENKPLIISTNISLDPKDTVIASNGSRSDDSAAPPPLASEPMGETNSEENVAFKPFQKVEKLYPSELLKLAPRLAAYTPLDYPDWRAIVDAAGDGLAVELGVSPSLWGEACRVLGRETASIALAVVSTKPKEHFTRGAGGYFAAMVKRAKKGELHLDRSLWALRRAKWGDEKRVFRAAG